MRAVVALLAAAVALAGCSAPTIEKEGDTPRRSLAGTVPYDVTLDALFDSLPEALTPYSEIVAAATALKASERATLLREGVSGLGAPILSVAIRGNGSDDDKAVVLATGSQHGNEPAGTEAAILLARYLAFGRPEELDPILDRATVVLVLNANPDGRAADQRGNASGIDINRDHMDLETPEGRLIHAIYNRVDPDVVLDLHQFGPGIDLGVAGANGFQVAGPQNPLVHSAVAEASYRLEGRVVDAVNSGFGPGWAVSYPPTTSSQDSSIHRNHYAMHNSASLLFEASVDPPGDPDLAIATKLHLVATLAVLEEVAATPDFFRGAHQQAQEEQRENRGPAYAYLFEPGGTADGVERLLLTHGLEVDVLPRTTVTALHYGTGLPRTDFPEGTRAVVLDQNDSRSAQEMFESSSTKDEHYTRGPHDAGLEAWRAMEPVEGPRWRPG